MHAVPAGSALGLRGLDRALPFGGLTPPDAVRFALRTLDCAGLTALCRSAA